MPDRPYHHGHLREALLVAAERALVRDGLSGLSLRDLAREVGVSHAAPRRHFVDRQALLDALAEHGFQQLGAQLREALSADPDVAGRLRAVGLCYFRFATQNAALLEVMYAGKHRPGADSVAAAAAEAFVPPLEVVQQARSERRLRSGDVAVTSTLLWAGLHGLASLSASGLLGDQDVESLVEQLVGALLTGRRSDRPSGSGGATGPGPRRGARTAR